MPRVLTIVFLFGLASAASAAAQDREAASPTTRLIPYSAVMSGADAIAGTRTVTFALFDEAEGGTLLWSETQVVRVDARGRYTAYLGANVPLPLEIFRAEQARWLEASVDGHAEPRVMLVAVPYALRAADAETLGGKPLSEFVLTDGSRRRIRADGTTIDDPAIDGSGAANQIAKWVDADTLGSSSIITESVDGRIGILTTDPTVGGLVDSRLTIRQWDSNTAIGVFNIANQRRFAVNPLPTGGFQLFDGVSGRWNAGVTQENGRLSIGPSPGASPNAVAKVGAVGTSAERSAIFAKKANFNTTITKAIHARSDPGVPGPLIGAFVGIEANVDQGFNAAVYATTTIASGTGIRTLASGTNGIGITAIGNPVAGNFTGNVNITGTLTKGGGAFEIDHPLDPANKYLRHSFVESPDMMNVYNGNAVLDASGEAWVTLPEWFEALNRDFRYQLTPIGAPGRDLHVAVEVTGNRFKIAGGRPGGKVSWQVTGIRQDAWANLHRIQVEEDKRGDEAGRYLHPDAHGLAADMAVPSARPDAGVVVRKQ
jgi:hypothetical protein